MNIAPVRPRHIKHNFLFFINNPTIPNIAEAIKIKVIIVANILHISVIGLIIICHSPLKQFYTFPYDFLLIQKSRKIIFCYYKRGKNTSTCMSFCIK